LKVDALLDFALSRGPVIGCLVLEIETVLAPVRLKYCDAADVAVRFKAADGGIALPAALSAVAPHMFEADEHRRVEVA
jgi:hypothetical protein